MQVKTKEDIRERIHRRIRKRMTGTPQRPRLAVFRSQSHIYAQVIDDDAGRTICSASARQGAEGQPRRFRVAAPAAWALCDAG